MARTQLRAVEQEVEEAADAAMEEAADAVESALSDIQAQAPKPMPKMRIKNARDWSERMLAELSAAEQELQTKIAAADAAFESTVSQAQSDRDRIKSEVAAELKQVTALRSATTIFKGELVKAEL